MSLSLSSTERETDGNGVDSRYGDMSMGKTLELHFNTNVEKSVICGRSEGSREGNVLFNDALNTFYWFVCFVGLFIFAFYDATRAHCFTNHWLLAVNDLFLINDVIMTFCLHLYGIGHLVKYHPVSEKTRCRLFLISNKGSVA